MKSHIIFSDILTRVKIYSSIKVEKSRPYLSKVELDDDIKI